MEPQRWKEIDTIFAAALERDSAERPAFLAEACGGDAQLRKEVESLIAHIVADDLAGGPAAEEATRLLASDRHEPEITSIGPYQVVKLLGAGGMGRVYLTHDPRLNRQVAVKLLSRYGVAEEERIKRFRQEALAASALNHPNILTIHEIGDFEGQNYISTEFIDGITLRARLSDGELPLAAALEIATQMTAALTAAHGAGIVHRDIKPENVMIRSDGLVKVLDFGIAKYTQAAAGDAKDLVETKPGFVIGTAPYMSPEQARGLPVDARTDVWSLGVVLYEMLSRSVPFKGHTKQDVVASILKEEPAPLSLKIPDRVRWIVEKALRKDREERYQTAREILSDLRDLPRSSAELRLATEHTPAPELKPEDRVTANIAHLGEHTNEGRVASTGNIQFFFARMRHPGAIAIVVLLAFLIAIGALVVGLYKFASRDQKQTTQNQTKSAVNSQSMKMTRLTTTGKASAAAISPDGKLVVHVVDDGKQQSLWIRQVSTSSNVQIIPPAEVTYLGLTFSPGGDYLYYILWDRTSYWALYQMPMLGGAAKRLTLDIDSDVTFSPDGKQYAFLRGYPTQGKFAVLVANADGTAERSLTTHGLVSGPSGDPAWSPDGKIIAYPVVNTDANGDFQTLFEVPVAGGSEKSIGSQRWSEIGRMAWLRDGSGLLVIAKEDVASPSQIWYVSYPGGKAHRITQDLNDYQDLTSTADSSALVTVQSDQVSNIWTAPNETPGRASQVTSGKFDGLKSLSWTPDGKIVYDSAASGHLDLWVSNSNGTGQKQLTVDAGNNSWPSVSPDGKYVVFVSDRTGTHHLWRIDIDGSNATQLTQGPGESSPHCSPDGQWVAFKSRLSQSSVMKVSIMGGEAIKIGINAGGAPAISPDGKSIAATHWEPANINTAIYPLEGGEPSKFLEFAGYYLRWTPDGRSLAYVDDRNASAIISRPISGGPERQLADFKPDQIFSFAWSRDGKQLAVARGTVTHDVILISNFIDQR